MRKILLLLLLLALPGFAQTYYVNPEHLSANDSNAGTLQAPWATLAPVSALTGGGTVYVFTGNGSAHSFTNTTVIDVASTITDNREVIVRLHSGTRLIAVGNGPKPILDGGSDDASTVGVLIGIESSEVRGAYIEGFEINGCGTGIFMLGRNFDCVIKDCLIDDNDTSPTEVGGIGMSALCNGSRNQIIDSTISNSYGDGVTVGLSSKDWWVENCTIEDNGAAQSTAASGGLGGDGIAFHTENSGTVINCTIDGAYNKNVNNSGTGRLLVIGCTIRNIHYYGLGNPDIGGEVWAVGNTFILDNHTHLTGQDRKGCIGMFAQGGSSGEGTIYAIGNTFLNLGQQTQDCSVLLGVSSTPAGGKCYLYGNLFYADHSNGVHVRTNGGLPLGDHNIYADGGSGRFRLNLVAYDFTTWKNYVSMLLTPTRDEDYFARDQVVDPLFVSASTGDGRLNIGSPAIGYVPSLTRRFGDLAHRTGTGKGERPPGKAFTAGAWEPTFTSQVTVGGQATTGKLSSSQTFNIASSTVFTFTPAEPIRALQLVPEDASGVTLRLTFGYDGNVAPTPSSPAVKESNGVLVASRLGSPPTTITFSKPVTEVKMIGTAAQSVVLNTFQ